MRPVPAATGVRARGARSWVIATVVVLVCAAPAAAQQTMAEVLSFLMTNRSIATDDFVRDEEAAVATSETISRLLAIELTTLPVASSASGFLYRFDPTLGTVSRLSDSFGPFFTDRSLTTGRRVMSFSMNYRSATFDTIDGRNLRDGTLVSTASRFRGEAQPFDVETVALRIRTDTFTVAAGYGVTDHIEVSAAVPIVRLRLQGERTDTYRGQRFLQAAGVASASGVGDVVLRAKYNVVRTTSGGVAVAGESRLATGDEDQLLGAGQSSFQPRLLASIERARVTLHGDVGYSFRGLADQLLYSGAVTYVAAPRLTLIGELSGRRLDGFGRLVETTEAHPRLIGIDTVRLTGSAESTNRLLAVAGFKWNIGGTWLVSANVVRPLTSVGLNARWVPAFTLDYAFGQ